MELKQQGLERQKLEHDLASLQELCVKLDKQKENLSREVSDRDVVRSQVQISIFFMDTEVMFNLCG